MALTEHYFGDLRHTRRPDERQIPFTIRHEARVRLVERETEQAHLCIGLPALPYTTERRYVQSTIEAILSPA